MKEIQDINQVLLLVETLHDFAARNQGKAPNTATSLALKLEDLAQQTLDTRLHLKALLWDLKNGK